MVNKKTDIKISIILKTENNDKYLYEILESIKQFSEIIAIDYQSNDESPEILKEYKAKIIYCNKNDCSPLDYIINQAENDWILVLDKNEILPLNLFNKIKEIYDTEQKNAQSSKKAKNIFTLSKKYFYLNKEIKFLKENNEIRFFKKNFCTLNYDFTTTIKQSNKKENLKIYSINRNFKHTNEYILKFLDNNISLNIQEILNKNKNSLKNHPQKHASIILKPMMTFFKYYFLKGGIFEGLQGFLFSAMKYFENLILEIMIQEENFKGEKYDI